MKKFIEYLQQKFAEINSKLPNDKESKVMALREQALKALANEGLPTSKDELWRHYPVEKQLFSQFDVQVEADPYQPLDQYFKCSVHDINTDMFTMLNGWYAYKNAPLTTFPNGVIVGSIMAAVQQYPELVLSHLAKFYSDKADKFVRLNELFFNDGFFVYVPDQVSVENL